MEQGPAAPGQQRGWDLGNGRAVLKQEEQQTLQQEAGSENGQLQQLQQQLLMAPAGLQWASLAQPELLAIAAAQQPFGMMDVTWAGLGNAAPMTLNQLAGPQGQGLADMLSESRQVLSNPGIQQHWLLLCTSAALGEGCSRVARLHRSVNREIL